MPFTTPQRVHWRHSLRTRLIQWSSLGSALLLCAACLILYVGARATLVDQSRRELHGTATQTALALQVLMDSVAVSAKTLASSVQRTGDRPRTVKALQRAAVEGNAGVVGAMVIIEPGTRPLSREGFHWSVRSEADGFSERSMHVDGYDYHDHDWWRRTVDTGTPWWSEPYSSSATGDVLLVTYNMPLRAAAGDPTSPVVGMVSLDMPVERLRALVGVGGDDTLRRVLTSPELRFVVHPLPDLVGTRLEDLVDRTDGLAPMLAAVRAHREAEVRFHDPISRTDRIAITQPIGDTGMAFGLSASEELIVAQLRSLTRLVLAGGLVAILALVLVMRLAARRVTRPLAALARAAGYLALGKFDVPVPHGDRRDEVGLLARAFDHARNSIKAQLAEIDSMATARQKLDSELSIAREIQLAMLPANRVIERGHLRLEAHAVLQPAKAVGGDFYCIIERGDDQLWFAVGDVSDKGVPAALFMARTVTMLEVAAGMATSPDEVLAEASMRLVDGNDTCMFATVLCGHIDVRTGTFELASAGHEPPIVLRANGESTLLGMQSGAALGFEASAHFPIVRGQLHPGDSLLAYTDGITEAFDIDDQAFGDARMLAAVRPSCSAHDNCDGLLAQVRTFAAEREQSDDITVLAIRLVDAAQDAGTAADRATNLSSQTDGTTC